MQQRYQTALDAVLQSLLPDPTVQGILFFGSVQRGTPSATSDLDFYVLVEGGLMWRETRLIEGVEAELFYNPVEKMERRLQVDGDRTAILAFASGQSLYDPQGHIARLIGQAQQLAKAGPAPLTTEQIMLLRYRLSDLSRDLEDVLGEDAASAALVAGQLLHLTLEACCQLANCFGDKPKRLLHHVARHDTQLQAMARDVLLQHDPKVALAAAAHVLTPLGGRVLAWQSEKIPAL